VHLCLVEFPRVEFISEHERVGASHSHVLAIALRQTIVAAFRELLRLSEFLHLPVSHYSCLFVDFLRPVSSA
jgi:hypothetical protein